MAFLLYGGMMKKLILMILLCAIAHAQEYPQWFLFQDQVNCKTTIVTVMKAPSLYRDSAIVLAVRAGCDLLAKYTSVTIKGGQAFWTTEAGVYSMGAHYDEYYDSSLADHYRATLAVLDYFVDKQKLIVLSGDSSACSLDGKAKRKISIEKEQQPDWVEELPNDDKYIYGVGSSEEYYYEASSWERAEHNSLMSLARSARSSIKSMQKRNSIEFQDVFDENVNVVLQNVEIVSRWRDVKKKIFYVLSRATR